MKTSKKRAKVNLDSAADLIAAELENIFDRSTDEIDNVREELRNDNSELIQGIDWSLLTPAQILAHPQVRKLMEAHIENVIEHLTYMNDDEDDSES